MAADRNVQRMELNLSDKQFVFIVGAPRSGTTWLQSSLDTHPEIASLGNIELRFFSEYIHPLLKAWENEKAVYQKFGVGLHAVLKKEEFEKYLLELLFNVYSKVLNKNPSAKIILDKYPGNSLQINTINKLLPNAKFIHIIRNPLDAITSMLSVNKREGFGFDNVLDSAKYWNRCVDSCNKWSSKIPNQFFEIRYEDLVQNQSYYLNKIFLFLGIAHSEEIVQNVIAANTFDIKPLSSPKRASESSDNTLNNKEINIIIDVCQKMIEKYEYDVSRNKNTKNSIIKSAFNKLSNK